MRTIGRANRCKSSLRSGLSAHVPYAKMHVRAKGVIGDRNGSCVSDRSVKPASEPHPRPLSEREGSEAAIEFLRVRT